MKNIKSWALGALVLCSAFFCGCGNNRQENLKECEQYVYMDSLTNAHVCGFVSDADGNALANVMITSGEDTIFSSEEGVFSFERCRTVNGRCVVKFENSEYFSVIRTAEIVDGGARVDAVMMPQDTKEGVTEVARFLNSQGATIKVGKMEISIPANSLVYENDGSAFDGSVLASVYYLDPNSEDFAKEMPGGDMSGVTNDGKNVILLSYGMVEVSLKDSSDRKLQLKEGAESSLSFPIPAGFSDDQKYDEIPLWYFDEEKGTWVEEGVATKKGDSYSGKVKHFSWHNLDYPWSRATIRGRVLNQDGTPLPNVLVTISQTSAYSDSAGYYWAFVPQNTPVFVTVRPSDYANCTTCPIYQVEGLRAETTYTQDIVLPNRPFVFGRVMGKDSSSIRGIAVRINESVAVTDWYGKYAFYFDAFGPVSLGIDETKVLNGVKYEKYEFNDVSEIDKNRSYDFIIERPIRVFGWMRLSNGRNIKSPITVTALLDGKEFQVKSSSYGGYGFMVSAETQEVTTYVKADDAYGIESSRSSDTLKKGNDYLYMRNIRIPAGISVLGTIVNTCGPSKANVTMVVGKGKNRKEYTTNTKWGNFEFSMPATMKDSEVKLKINCQGKRLTKKVELESEFNRLEDIEICSGEDPDPDCIYAIVGDETIKFDTKKDLYTEMFQRAGKGTKYEEFKYKYQAWYKNPKHDETLIIEFDDGSVRTYLLSDEIRAQKYLTSLSKSKKGNVYSVKTNCELYDDTDTDDDDIYLYGSADIERKSVYDVIDTVYVSKNIYSKVDKILVGVSHDTKFQTMTLPKDVTRSLENNLRNSGFKEKSTYMDDEQRIATIYLQDNAEALVHRNKDNTSDVTFLTRDGIGNEPLFNCWKVDFRKSSLKQKGRGNIDYMWKNEADVAQLVMFGQIMGVKFSKTTDDKCGCFVGSVPAVAEKK